MSIIISLFHFWQPVSAKLSLDRNSKKGLRLDRWTDHLSKAQISGFALIGMME
jgi:hypothetical protein